MTKLRSLPLCVLAGALFAAASASTAVIAQQTAAQVRIVNPIDENQLVTLKGNVHPAANAKNDRGPVSASLPMANLVLVLSRSAEQQAAFDAFVKAQYDSGSPSFHQWLTADEIGQRFGPSETDIATIRRWLASHGFAVSHTANDRMSITFSGTAGQVESAFHTSIHNLSVNGVAHIANMTNPQVPAALAPVVVGIKQLHDFHPHPLHRVGSVVQFNQQLGKWQRVGSPATAAASLSAQAAKTTASTGTAKPRPLFTDPATSESLVEEDVSPFDFATIYNVLPLWNSSITGSNQTIAIVGTSDINLSDVSSYKSTFGLPAGVAPEEVKGANGIDPGVCTSTTNLCSTGDLEENTLDVEVSGGVATGAQIVLVTSGYNSQTNPTNDPIFDSSQYIEENINTSTSPVYGAHVMSVSYGLCELGEGTSGNVTYYNLWQSAAAEGIAVFVASGDSGSPSCDQGEDENGNPYSAQFGLSVSGVASTPYNTAVGGTDFSWCQPKIVASGNEGLVENCPTATGGSYWNSTNASNNSSAKGYVPETPWNDTCENPIWATYLESIATFVGVSGATTPEEACNFVENNWYDLYESGDPVLAGLVDTVGGGGGASNCVVNDADTDPDDPTCTTGATSVSTANGTVTLSNNGWPVPSWQTGATGTSGLTSRSIPDVSFFSGDGSLDSATLICLEAIAGVSCTSSTVASSALEIGGTSVASPEMAGVMALINQKAGGPQGSPNSQLYQLAGKQTYSACSAETVTSTNSPNCYFQSIDEGTNSMPCSLGAAGGEGGAVYAGGGNWQVSPLYEYTGNISPNCTAINSGDVIGTLVSSGTTPGYNATAGFNLATGLGSLNVANVANAWVSDAGTHTATMAVTLSPTGTITSTTVLTISVAVSGTDGTPTGSVAVSGSGFSGNGTLNGSGDTTITVPAGTLAPGSDSLTVTYGGDSNYASTQKTETVTVSAAVPTVTVSAPASGNINNALTVTVGVSGPSGSAAPTGTVTLAQTSTGGIYSSPAETLSSGTASITIPKLSLTAGIDTLTATYSGNSAYTTATGSTTVTMVGTALATPTVTVTPGSPSVDTGQSLTLAVKVSGTSGTPTGTVTLTVPNISSAPSATLDPSGSAPLTIPAGSFTSTGTPTITVSYSGDATYGTATGSTTETVTASTYVLAASTPAAVSPGSTATSTVTGTSSTFYSGKVTLNSCTLTASPTGASSLPTCSVTGTITYASGTPTGSGTATASTTAASSAELIRPAPLGKGRGWMGAGGGAVLAFLVFLGIPARRRGWRAMLGVLVILAALGSLSACGGGGSSGGGGGGTPGTTAGSYTFTVTGQGNDPASTTESTTFTLTVN
jgi:subtilase family serine protease